MQSDSLKGVWWNEEDERKTAESITATVTGLRKLQSQRDSDALIFLRMYGGKEAVSYYMGVAMGVGAYTNSASEPVHGPRLNMVQSCCDTVNAKITLSKPKITFLTSGGDYAAQRKAKKLEQFQDGVFYQTNQHQLSPQVSLDAMVLGTGIEHIYAERGKIKHEKVIPSEITIDEVEGIYGNPRTFYRTKLVQKDLLAALFPERRDEIWNQKAETYSNGAGITIANMLPLVASWHLPSIVDSDAAGDGRCCIAVNDLLLADDEWKRDYPPFAFLRWLRRPIGFWGQGLAEQLIALQVELNNVSRTISDTIRLGSVLKVFVENGSKVNVAQLDRTIGAVVNYTGTKPEFGTPQVLSPDLVNRESFLWGKGYEVSGVSQLSASSKIPAGLQNASGKALETYLDAETERFSVFADDYQQFHMDVSKQDIDLARELYGDGEEIEVTVPGKRFLQSIRWGDINLENDAYIMQRWPTNFLADDPADRMKQVQDMSAAGWINQDMAMDLLDFPDLKSFLNLKNAGVETLKYIIECILEEGRYIPPEPFFNLQLGIQMMQSVYGTLIQQDAPESKKDLVRNWISQAQDILSPPAPDPAAAGGPPGAPPMGPGGPPGATGIAGGPAIAKGAPAPVSPLLPFQKAA
jgi:hypothetical protein